MNCPGCVEPTELRIVRAKKESNKSRSGFKVVAIADCPMCHVPRTFDLEPDPLEVA